MTENDNKNVNEMDTEQILATNINEHSKATSVCRSERSGEKKMRREKQ